jgi:hypothetical protein
MLLAKLSFFLWKRKESQRRFVTSPFKMAKWQKLMLRVLTVQEDESKVCISGVTQSGCAQSIQLSGKVAALAYAVVTPRKIVSFTEATHSKGFAQFASKTCAVKAEDSDEDVPDEVTVFVSFGDLTHHKDTFVSVQGKVHFVSQVTEVKSQEKGELLKRLVIALERMQERKFEITLWGENALRTKVDKGAHIQVHGVKVGNLICACAA